MTRDEWVQLFQDEIVKLRPHLAGSKMAYTLALQKYDRRRIRATRRASTTSR